LALEANGTEECPSSALPSCQPSGLQPSAGPPLPGTAAELAPEASFSAPASLAGPASALPSGAFGASTGPGGFPKPAFLMVLQGASAEGAGSVPGDGTAEGALPGSASPGPEEALAGGGGALPSSSAGDVLAEADMPLAGGGGGVRPPPGHMVLFPMAPGAFPGGGGGTPPGGWDPGAPPASGPPALLPTAFTGG